MEHYGIFTEEVIHSWCDYGRIMTTLPPEEARSKILTGLGRTVRFNGIMNVPWTVLKHSWMVGVLAEDYAITDRTGRKEQLSARLMGMLHDIGEAIVGDMVWPLKHHGQFKDAYERYYQPLEIAFRNWAGEYAFGIDGFEEKYFESQEYVDRADAFMGEMELYGASAIAEYGFAQYAGSFFRDMPDVDAEAFVKEIEFLKGKLEEVDDKRDSEGHGIS